MVPDFDYLADDTGDDYNIREEEIEDFRVEKDKDARVAFLLPTHKKAFVHKVDMGPRYSMNIICKSKRNSEGYVVEPDWCCNRWGNDHAFPYWFNVVLEYFMDLQRDRGQRKMVVRKPVDGEVKLFRFKKQKYIQLRKALEKQRELHGTAIKFTDFDVDVSLDGEETYQKMSFQRNDVSLLKRKALFEIVLAIAKEEPLGEEGENISDIEETIGQITEILSQAEGNTPEDKVKNAVRPLESLNIPYELLIKYSPTLSDIYSEVERILKHVTKYRRFALDMSEEEVLRKLEDSSRSSEDIGPDESESVLDSSAADDILGDII